MVDNLIRISPSEYDTWKNGGYGVLSDALSCTVTEELNGAYELTMEYPVTGGKFEYLVLRNIIITKPNPYDKPQPFRIYSLSKPINGVVTVNAEHLRYDMGGIPVGPIIEAESPQDVATQMEGQAKIVDSPYKLFTYKSEDPEGFLTTTAPKSMLSLIGGSSDSIISTFGGEVEWDGLTATIVHRRGSDTVDKRITYGKNMTDFVQEETADNLYTHVYPYYEFTQNDETEIFELPDKLVAVEGEFDFKRILLLDLNGSWNNDRYLWRDEFPAREEILEVTEKYIEDNKIGKPVKSLNISFISLRAHYDETLQEWVDLEQCHLGDSVFVEFEQYGVADTLRVTAVEYNAITDSYNSVTLGDPKQTLTSSISQKEATANETNNAITQALTNEGSKSLYYNDIESPDGEFHYLKADVLEAEYATITNLTATNGYIAYLEGITLKYQDIEASTGRFNYLTSNNLYANYAGIDFANIDVAQIRTATLNELFANSSYIERVTSASGTFTDYLRAVKIEGDVIEANTISAKSLIIRRDDASGNYQDGLIYQINAQSGELTAAQLSQETYRKKLDGSDLVANSVTAREITANNITGPQGWINLQEPAMNLNNQLTFQNGKLYVNADNINLAINNVKTTADKAASDIASTNTVVDNISGRVTSNTNNITALQLADQNITAKVASMNRDWLFTSNSSGTSSTLQTWGDSSSVTFTVNETLVTDSSTAKGIKAGDLCDIRVTNTTTGRYAYIHGKVTSFNVGSRQVTIQGLGYDNTSPMAAVIAEINLAPGTATINASKINLQGVVNVINNGTTTTINGDRITTGSIKAAQIDVSNVFAQTITATGSITGLSLYGAIVETNSNAYSGHVGMNTRGFEAYFPNTSASEANAGLWAYYGGIRIKGTSGTVTNYMMQGGCYSQYGFTSDGNSLGAQGSITIVPNNSNEINFGGSNTNTAIYFGYRATGNRGKPLNYYFGQGSGDSVAIRAASFYENGISLASKYNPLVAINNNNQSLSAIQIGSDTTVVSSGKWTSIGTISVPAGRSSWVVTVTFPASSSGSIRGIKLGTSSGSSEALNEMMQDIRRVHTNTSYPMYCRVVFSLYRGSALTLYVNVFQDTGSSMGTSSSDTSKRIKGRYMRTNF